LSEEAEIGKNNCLAACVGGELPPENRKPACVLKQQQHPFNGLFSRTTWVIQYQKGQTISEFQGSKR